MPHPSSITLVMATTLEALPLLEMLSLTQTAKRPFSLYRSEGLVLILSGIGKVNAAMAATYSILMHCPALVVNLGAAGAVRPGCALGDVYQAGRVIDYDRPHLTTQALRIMKPLVLPGCAVVRVATQDKPALDQDCRAALAGCADLVDMEAAGVIQACERFSVPCSVFKFVSDTPDHTLHEDIVDNIKSYRNSFSEFVVRYGLPMMRQQVAAHR